jgi:hypothetical protein
MKRTLLAGFAAVVVWIAAGPAARAAEQEAIDKAINRGVDYLKQDRDAGAGWSWGPTHAVGIAALTGLTLLECDVPADDPHIQKAAELVRSAAPALHNGFETYELSLAVLFLDRLGDPKDETVLRVMAVRLMAGQGAGGGWSYTCPLLPDTMVRSLTTETPPPSDQPGKNDDSNRKPNARSPKELPKGLPEQIARLTASPAPALDGLADIGDNSNTQFATLALWVCRRHGLPVDPALARVGERFHKTQNPDGGWSYMPSPDGVITTLSPPDMAMSMNGSRATTTCAGLLGLAVAHGPQAEAAVDKGKEVPDLGADPFVKRGLAFLGKFVGGPVPPVEHGPIGSGRLYYYFWSLERVAVVLDLDKIGGRDWYAWGSEILLANQGADGSWRGEYPGPVDTCFALLFLKRVNVARDLTSALKGKNSVTLKSGGGGVAPLKNKPKPDEPLTSVKPPQPAQTRPPAEESEGARMASELVQAPAEQRDDLVQKYRDGKGVAYTEGLAGAIPQLNGEDRRKARDALADRLTRMKAETLTRYLQDQDAEIRRAAALAAAMKEAKDLIPDLIPLLSDPEETVAHAAHAALKDLTGKNLGPTEEEWKAWWKNRKQ